VEQLRWVGEQCPERASENEALIQRSRQQLIALREKVRAPEAGRG
jgi:hypothetical protein